MPPAASPLRWQHGMPAWRLAPPRCALSRRGCFGKAGRSGKRLRGVLPKKRLCRKKGIPWERGPPRKVSGKRVLWERGFLGEKTSLGRRLPERGTLGDSWQGWLFERGFWERRLPERGLLGSLWEGDSLEKGLSGKRRPLRPKNCRYGTSPGESGASPSLFPY